MKKIILKKPVFILILAFCLFLSVSSALAYWDYQEDANSTSCTGSWSGTYPCSNTYDGDWLTRGEANSNFNAFVYLNYTKPQNSYQGTLWEVKDVGGITNLTLPSSCWRYYDNYIYLRAESTDLDSGNSGVDWDCYNGSWKEVRSNRGSGTAYRVFEEAMWWWIQYKVNWTTPEDGNSYSVTDLVFNYTLVPVNDTNTSNLANCSLYRNDVINITQTNLNYSIPLNFTLNYGLNVNRTDDYYIFCDNGDDNYTTDTRTITVDNINPTITTDNFIDNSAFHNTIEGQFIFHDVLNIHSYNISIDGIQKDGATGLTTTNIVYNLSEDISNLSAGAHNLSIRVADGHTANKIGNYDWSNGIFNDYIKYQWNKEFIKTESKSKSISDKWTTKKEKDRYTQTFEPGNPSSTITLIEESSDPIYIKYTPKYYNNYWIVSGNHWKDYVVKNEPNAKVSIKKINDYKVEVTISGIKNTNKLEFESIGDLNVVWANYTFYAAAANETYSNIIFSNFSTSYNLTIDYGNLTYNTSSYQPFAFLNWNGTNNSATLLSFNNSEASFTWSYTPPEISATKQIIPHYWLFNLNKPISIFYSNSSNFNDGSYTRTLLNNSFVQLNLTYNNGTYVSEVFDSILFNLWNTISWHSIEYPTLINGTILRYDMNDASGNLTDYSGYNNYGIVNGSPIYNQTGIYDKAITFDGTTDYFTVQENGTSMNISDGYSFAFWFKVTGGYTQWMPVIGQCADGGGWGDWQLSLNPDDGWVLFANTNTTGNTNYQGVYSKVYDLDEWTHVIGAFNSTDKTIWVNGVKYSGTSNGDQLYNQSNPLKIGACDVTGSVLFNGTLDEINMYNYHLSDAQAQAIYEGATKLNLSVRSCDDSSCSGENWTNLGINKETKTETMNLPSNRYFQYLFNFTTNDQNYTSKLYNVTILSTPSANMQTNTQNQTLYDIRVDECAGAINYPVINLSYFDEVSNDPINLTNAYVLDITDGTQNYDTSGLFTESAATSNQLCTNIDPNDITYDWDLSGLFTLSKDGYVTRIVDIDSETPIAISNNPTTQQSLFLIKINESSTVKYNWYTTNFQLIDGTMRIYRCNDNGSKDLTESIPIISGVANANIQLLTQPYSYDVIINGLVYQDTDSYSRCHIETETELTFYVDVNPVDLTGAIGLYGILCKVTRNGRNVTMTWGTNPEDSSAITGCLIDTISTIFGNQNATTNCTSTGFTNTITVANDGNNHNVRGQLKQSGNIRNCNSVTVSDLTNDGGTWGITGLFAVFLLIVSMALFYAGDGEIQLVGAAVGTVIAWIIGILNFDWKIVSAIIVFSIIIVVVGRYGRRPR